MISVKIHGLAAVISFFNLMRAASVFNERTTFTLLFVLVGYPFLLFTILSRTIAVAVIACFLDVWWTIVLLAGLITTNLIVYSVCRKRQVWKLPSKETLLRTVQIRGDIEEQIELRCKLQPGSSQNSSCEHISCCSKRNKQNAKNAVITEPILEVRENSNPTFWDTLPKLFIMSVCSIVIPVGYTNDTKSHHPKIKGGLFISLNYLFNMLWIGLALGFTIVNDVPNT